MWVFRVSASVLDTLGSGFGSQAHRFSSEEVLTGPKDLPMFFLGILVIVVVA